MSAHVGIARTSEEAKRRGYSKIAAPGERDPKKGWIHISHGSSTKDVGSLCYIGPCYQDGSGTRPVCYIDEEGACDDCYDEPDAPCD